MALADVVKRLEAAPPGSLVPASWILEQLRDEVSNAPAVAPAPDPATAVAVSIWTCDPEQRFTVKELAKAIGKSAAWIYHRTHAKADRVRLPHGELDGSKVFVASQVRAYLLEHEVSIVKPTTSVVPITSRRRS